MIRLARLAPSLLIALVAVFAVASCTYGPVHHRGEAYPSHYHDYYYYPHADVYFQIYTGEYYYRAGRDWRRVRVLPRTIYLDPKYRVTLRITDPRPYVHAPAHRQAHPPPRARYVPNREHDRAEREHNLRRYDEYRERYGR